MESEVVKGGRVVSVDNQSDLRRLGMERLRERLIKFPLHFMVEGGRGEETSSSTLVLLARVNFSEWYAE